MTADAASTSPTPSRSSCNSLAGILGTLGLVGVWTDAVSAHEQYVVDETESTTVREMLATVLSDPVSIGLLIGGGVTVMTLMLVYLIVQPFQADIAAFRRTMDEYAVFVPWLLRISFGVPLIGAGFSGYFISPAVEVDLRLLQVTLGFVLLFGLATRFVALAGLLVYCGGVLIYPGLLLQLEFVGGMAAIALVGSGKPSADHVLYRISSAQETVYGRVDVVQRWARTLEPKLRPYARYVPTVTRVGLGITFIFLGLSQKLLQPGLALAVVDRYGLTAVVPVQPELWVVGSGLAEIALGLLLIFGLFTRASALTAILIFTLTLFALPDDPVLAHVGLYGLASVLIITGSGPSAIDQRLSSAADTEYIFIR